jgi:thioredoxin 1
MSSRGTGKKSESRPTQQTRNTEQNTSKEASLRTTASVDQKKQNKQLAQQRRARQRWWNTTGKKLVGFAVIVLAITGLILGIVFGTDATGVADKRDESNQSGTSRPTLIDIGSTSCFPCQQLQPVLAELRADYGSKVDVKFYDSWNTTAGANMAKKYNVTTIPTLIFLDADGKEVARMTGYQSYDVIVAKYRALGWI